MQLACVALLLGSVAAKVVRLTDVVTNRPVTLIGTMHYNPHSIATVDATVREAASWDGIHATAIELCASRWDAANSAARTRSLVRDDEFAVAYEASLQSGFCEVVLCDQPISQTARRLRQNLCETAIDLASPGGWQRIASDLAEASAQLVTFVAAATDKRLVAGMPLALLRYFYNSPLPLFVLSAAGTALCFMAAAGDGSTAAWSGGPERVLALLALAVGLTRAVFVALIAERNRVIAINIREACRRDMMPSRGSEASVDGTATVVAVIGMAHLEGVRACLLLDEQLRTNPDLGQAWKPAWSRPLADRNGSARYPALRERTGAKWVARGGSGSPHPGGDGCSFETHRARLAAELDDDPEVGEPLLRRPGWTRNESAFRSSVWADTYDAQGCVQTGAEARWCARDGSFRRGKPTEVEPASEPCGEWIVFDLEQEESLAKIRLVSYWSDEDNFSAKDITVERAPSLRGPYVAVAAYAGLPRSAESKAVDLYVRGTSRYWRVRCTATHGGSAFGLYGVDFWRRGAADPLIDPI